MKPTQKLHDLGQSLWLDNITRGLLTSGTLRHYIDDFSVTGLTSNPSIFDLAIKNSNFYDDAIRQKRAEGKSGETLFFELAIEDLRQAADLFRPVHDATADHGSLGEMLPADGGDAEMAIAAFAKAGIDAEQLAADLQREGAEAFVESWNDLLEQIGSKSAALKAAG
jgi:transaldolase